MFFYVCTMVRLLCLARAGCSISNFTTCQNCTNGRYSILPGATSATSCVLCGTFARGRRWRRKGGRTLALLHVCAVEQLPMCVYCAGVLSSFTGGCGSCGSLLRCHKLSIVFCRANECLGKNRRVPCLYCRTHSFHMHSLNHLPQCLRTPHPATHTDSISLPSFSYAHILAASHLFSLSPPPPSRNVVGVAGAGFACPAGSANQTQCLAGRYSAAGQSTCSPCNAGYACPVGSISPTPAAAICPVGTFALAGSPRCSDCPAGRYGNSTGRPDGGCSGACTAGFACPPRSTNATAVLCLVSGFVGGVGEWRSD